MLKCAPYIKSLCSSLHSGWWKDGTSSLPGSPVRHPVPLPSPTRSENAAGLTSFRDDLTKDDDTDGDENNGYDSIQITQLSSRGHPMGSCPELHRKGSVGDAPGVNGDARQIHKSSLADVHISSLLSPQPLPPTATNSSTAVVSLTGNGEIVTSVIVNQPKSTSHSSNKSEKSGAARSETSVKSDLINVLKKIRPESPDVTRAAKRLEMARRQGAISKIPKQQQHSYKDSTPPDSPSHRR